MKKYCSLRCYQEKIMQDDGFGLSLAYLDPEFHFEN